MLGHLLPLLSLLLVAPATSLLLSPACRAPTPTRGSLPTRTPPSPHASALVDAPAAAAASLLLADNDVFGEVFMAGMSIAFAAVGATVLAGVIIRGKYDDIEQSMFDAQDEASDREAAKDNFKASTAVNDFFGDTVPRQEAPPSAKEPQGAE